MITFITFNCPSPFFLSTEYSHYPLSIGVGNMIDSCVMNIEYMAYKNVITLGTIVNKIPKKVSYHTPEKIKEYVEKFFSTYQYTTNNITTKDEINHKITIYGFVQTFDDDSNDGSCATSCATSCALKPNVDITTFDLEMDDNDWKELSRILKVQNKAVNFTQLFDDVKSYFEKQ